MPRRIVRAVDTRSVCDSHSVSSYLILICSRRPR